MIFTDLHLHSCLSPCGDDEMSPFDLVGMAKLNGLGLIALTDHNSAKNTPAAAAAAEEYGIGFIPGLEVNTSEDIHCIALFPDTKSALAFGEVIYDALPDIRNDPDIFGHQLIVHPDSTTQEETKLLITGCGISILELPSLTERFGGLCWPAHVDRESNGLFAVLGMWPEDLHVRAAEIRSVRPDGIPDRMHLIQASDAHRFADMPTVGYPLPLDSPDFKGLKQYILR